MRRTNWSVRMVVAGSCGFLWVSAAQGLSIGLSQPGKTVAGYETVPAPIDVDLRPRWAAGNGAKYVFTIEHEQVTGPKPPATGESTTITTRQEIHFTRRVVDVGEDSVRLGFTYDLVRVRISAGGATADVDTSTPASADGDSTLGEVARSVVGRTVNLTLTKDGRVTGIEGNNISRGNEPSARSLVGREVFDQQLTPMWGFPEVPDKPRTGSSWSHNQRLPMGHLGTLLTESRYQVGALSGEGDKLADVSITGPCRIVPAVGPAARPVEHREGEFSGQSQWNVTRGLLEKYQSTRTLGYNLTQGETTVQVSTKTQLSIVRIDAAPATNAPK